MTILAKIRQAFGHVRSGASDMAQAANLRLDLRNLEGRRDQLHRTIGKRAYDLHRLGRGIPEFDRLVREIDGVEASIAAKKDELRGSRERAGADPGHSTA